MALPPGILRKSSETRIMAAEARIDEAICRAMIGPVIVATKLLNVSCREWDEILAPKYFAAGWKSVKWVSDQRESFVELKP